jgi:hypothetical protein
MGNDLYKANGVDFKIRRKENKEIVEKAIDIIVDLFPTASRKDVSHILSVKGIEMRRSEERKVRYKKKQDTEENTTTTTTTGMDSHFVD